MSDYISATVALLGIAGAIVGLVTAIRTNAKWSGIVEHKMDTLVTGMTEVKDRLGKVEDGRADDRQAVTMLASKVEALDRATERLHLRVDRLTGGRDRDAP